MALELNENDIQKAKFAFSIYDFEGKDIIDAFHLGDCLRALDFTPSLRTISKFGGSTKIGERSFTIEEFLTIVGDAKKDNDIGCLPAYIEVLKCYDKHNDGKMPANLIFNILSSSGERMDHDSIQKIVDDCCDAPDDDGNIKYADFITKVCNGPASAFDDFDFMGTGTKNASASATIAAPKKIRPSISVAEDDGDVDASATATIAAPRKIRPSITVADEDTPSVSYAAAKPMIMPEAQEEPEPAAACFTLKAPRRSSSISPPSP